MQVFNLPRALSAGDLGRNVLFNKQAKGLFSALPGHANCCCVIQSKCGWITELVRALWILGWFTGRTIHGSLWCQWSLSLPAPSSSPPKASCSLGLQLSQDGKLLLMKANPKSAWLVEPVTVTVPLQAPAHLGSTSLGQPPHPDVSSCSRPLL